MTILQDFDPQRDGWSFENWGEPSDFSWDLYRRTYLAINPTNDVVEAPLDVAFFEIFKGCAKNGNCGGMSMLALALLKYGGYMGYCSPASFYTPANATDHKRPARADLHEAVNIMQARQFSAAGIRNFLDVVKAGQLNDGFAAWERVRSGLGSGDYCMLSLSNGVFGDAAHTIIPYRAEMSGSARVLYVWNSNRPYPWYPDHYTTAANRIVITSPTSWRYDQQLGATVYDGSNNGWFFAIPTSLEIHKGAQPISAGFALTGVMTLFVSGVGAAVTQIEDDEGRRLFKSDTLHRNRGDLETAPDKYLPGVAPWPWAGGISGERPGELFFIERPPGSSPLTVSVRGEEYRLMYLSPDHLTEVIAQPTASTAKDRIRVTGSRTDPQSVLLRTAAPERRFDVHHLRCVQSGAWRSVRVADLLVEDGASQVRVPIDFATVEISGGQRPHDVIVQLRRCQGGAFAKRVIRTHPVHAGQTLYVVPDWQRLARGKVGIATTTEPATGGKRRSRTGNSVQSAD